nr:MAG TPA: hypothetical protein [Caudoviricetes sp.]
MAREKMYSDGVKPRRAFGEGTTPLSAKKADWL